MSATINELKPIHDALLHQEEEMKIFQKATEEECEKKRSREWTEDDEELHDKLDKICEASDRIRRLAEETMRSLKRVRN